MQKENPYLSAIGLLVKIHSFNIGWFEFGWLYSIIFFLHFHSFNNSSKQGVIPNSASDCSNNSENCDGQIKLERLRNKFKYSHYEKDTGR